jgi:hypothetical protein
LSAGKLRAIDIMLSTTNVLAGNRRTIADVYSMQFLSVGTSVWTFIGVIPNVRLSAPASLRANEQLVPKGIVPAGSLHHSTIPRR